MWLFPSSAELERERELARSPACRDETPPVRQLEGWAHRWVLPVATVAVIRARIADGVRLVCWWPASRQSSPSGLSLPKGAPQRRLSRRAYTPGHAAKQGVAHRGTRAVTQEIRQPLRRRPSRLIHPGRARQTASPWTPSPLSARVPRPDRPHFPGRPPRCASRHLATLDPPPAPKNSSAPSRLPGQCVRLPAVAGKPSRARECPLAGQL